MSRPLRIHAPGLIYHVFARGNNRDVIFFHEADYQRFIENLERFRKQFHYNLFAYCLMPNHFHLLCQVTAMPLSKIMQTLLTAYTMYINKKYQHVGHVFQGRFMSIVVEKDTYFLQVQRYIHLNPVKANLAQLPQAYRWSSYRDYFQQTDSLPSLDKKLIWDMFSQNAVKQKQLLHEFTLAGFNSSFDPFIEQKRGVLGSSKFMGQLTRVLKGVRP